MTNRKSFYRKLTYGVAIAVLLYPLALLSTPATVTSPRGGTLSEMRIDNGLSQANLGEIDPASATMKLATLGLRGLAVNLLWGQADEYKKKEDWTNLTATLEQLALLQPNFITFWKFQSWNVSYNVSVQFDDYRDRYYYVRRGIEFLQEGIDKNKENRDVPQLLWDLGWFLGQKIGRADEYVQYRRLFKADDEFHGDLRPRGSDERDNWRLSKAEYFNGISAITDRGKSIGKKSERIYYSSPAKSQMSYAEAIGEEGQFEKGQAAWDVAADDWRVFGDRPITHSTGRKLFLGQEEQIAESVKQLEEQLDALAPGLRDEMVAERREMLSSEQLAAYEKPPEERNQSEWELAQEAEAALQVSDFDFVERLAELKPELRKQAGLLATRLADRRIDLIYTQRYKRDANYDYWALRAEFEQTDTAVEARRNIYQAKQAFDEDQDFQTAKQLYEEGFAKWREVLDRFPALLGDEGNTGDDLLVYVKDYRDMLKQRELPIPDDFPLWDVIENHDAEQEFVEDLRDYKSRTGQTARDGRRNDEQGQTPPGDEAPEESAGGETPEDTGEETEDAGDAEAGENEANDNSVADRSDGASA